MKALRLDQLLRHGEHVVSLLPDAELFVRPGESHLGGLGAAEEVLATLLAVWDKRMEQG